MNTYYTPDPSHTQAHRVLATSVRREAHEPHFRDEDKEAHRGHTFRVVQAQAPLSADCSLRRLVPLLELTAAALASALFPAAHPHLSLSPYQPPDSGPGWEGYPPARHSPNPAPRRVTFLMSCWFSFCSSPHLRLLSSSARDASRSPWMVLWRLWFSFSSFRMRLEAHSFSSNTNDFLEAEAQSRVSPRLQLRARRIRHPMPWFEGLGRGPRGRLGGLLHFTGYCHSQCLQVPQTATVLG